MGEVIQKNMCMWRISKLPMMALSDLEEDASMRDEGSSWLPGSGGLDSTLALAAQSAELSAPLLIT